MLILGLTIAEWGALLTGIFSFPRDMLALYRAFAKTPEDKKQDLIAKVQAEADAYEQTGRPNWG